MTLRLPFFAPLLALLSLAGAAPAPREALHVLPLDTAVVMLDSSLREASLDALETPPDGALLKRLDASPRGRVARSFHPVFGATIARAARKVEAIDSSASAPAPTQRVLRFARGRDTLAFPLPEPGVDSARYLLVLGRLALKETRGTVARRFVPPSPPEFDPLTGTVRPGNRKGYAEGPGRVRALKARAEWAIWDAREGKILHRGTARAEASTRGEITRETWETLARDLAGNVLRTTIFSPW